MLRSTILLAPCVVSVLILGFAERLITYAQTASSNSSVPANSTDSPDPSLTQPVPPSPPPPPSQWDIDVSRPPHLLVPYKDTFHVSVYKIPGATPGDARYFHAPALILLPNSTSVVYNNATGKYVVDFSLLMWDERFQHYIQDYIFKKYDRNITPGSINLLPISDIRLDAVSQQLDCHITTKWITYVSLPAVIKPSIVCNSESASQAVVDNIMNSPDQFSSTLSVFFSLQRPQRMRRSVDVTSDHIQSVELFYLLDQKYPNNTALYMQHADVQGILKEVASNLMDNTLEDDEFISQYQMLGLSVSLSRLLGIQSVSTGAFTADTWNAVYWPDENMRPDKRTLAINNLLNNSNSRIRNLLRSQAAGTDNGLLTGLTDADAPDFNTISDKIRQAKNAIQWNGDSYIPRAITIKQLNMTFLREEGTIGTMRIWVTKSEANLTSRINYVASHEFEDLMKGVYDAADVLHPTGSIIAYYNTTYLPDGWLWCNGARFNPIMYPKLAAMLYPSTSTPDLRGRFLLGAGTNYSRNIGTTGGEKDHTLTLAEMPSHSHPLQEGLQLSRTDLNNGIQAYVKGTDFFTTGAVGGGLPHNNMPPYTVVTYIIKG